MERNCQAHIKVEHKGKMTIYWRCLNGWTVTHRYMGGKEIYLCDEHARTTNK